MKKIIFSVMAMVALTASAVEWRSVSFLDPNVTAFYLTNGIGATNIESLVQAGSAASATNYSAATATCFMYTNGQPWLDTTLSNYWVLGGLNQTQYGVTLPGTLRVCVLSNITGSAGTMGVAPPNPTNTTIAVTNDMQNMFADVPLDPYVPIWSSAPLGGANSTNIIGTLTGTLLQFGGNSNYVTFVLTPVVTDSPDPTRPQKLRFPQLGQNLGYEVTAAGSTTAFALGLVPFTVSVTNWNSASPYTFSIQIPASSVYGAKALRIRSATAGTAAASGTAGLWISNLKFNGLSQYNQ